MIARSVRRLPGVQFESRPQQREDVLPRMDVAVFAGFASSGPLHLPVAVDDARAFADVFGADAPLAWDRERGELRRASLGPAVRAFFRDGGSRCWVIRVAREKPLPAAPHDWARSNRFPVPGLARLSGSSLRPAFVAARSEGSWSDRLGVGAAVQLQPVLARGAAIEGGQVLSIQLDVPDTVVVGDVLRLTWSQGSPLAPVAALHAPVVALDGSVARLGAERVWLLAAPPAPSGTPWSASWWLQGELAQALPAPDGEPQWQADGTVALTLTAQAPIPAGAFVVLSRGGEQVWVLVEETRTASAAGSPPVLRTTLTGRWSRPASGPPAGLLADPSAAITGERVRLELWVRDGGGHPLRLGDLGLAPGHPRFLGALPTDLRLFETGEDLLAPDEAALRDRVRALVGDGVDLREHHARYWQSVANPRFPLAVDQARSGLFLPLSMPVVAGSYLGAAPVPGEAAERDGLGRFDADLFLDPALAGAGSDLAAQAEFIRWQAHAPRRLTGIHAVFPLEEATLIAAPDAVQRGWSREGVAAAEVPETPLLSAVADAQGRWHLSWSSVAGASYALQQAGDAEFHAGQEVPLGSTAATAYEVPDSVPSGTWFRVRAVRTGTGGAVEAGGFWSDPVQVIVPPPQFVDCPAGALAAPVASLAQGPDAAGSYQLSWDPVDGAVGYEVQESGDLDFADAVVVYAGAAPEAWIYGRAPGRYQYRVRARGSLADAGAAIPLASGSYRVDVTGTDAPAHVLAAAYPGAIGEEIVFDGSAFTERFAGPGNTRAALSGGFRYLLTRDGGWPGAPVAPRFRAWDPAAVGPFGPGISAAVPAPARRVLDPVSAYDGGTKPDMLSVHAALLRLCAARGDLLAVLGLPEHYRENEAARHAGELRALLPDETSWAHGALYHPWLVVESDADLVRAPPDGAACGVLARRAARRGAWVAPANEPLDGVFGLVPAIPRSQWARLLDARVNLVREEPHGFVVLSEETLSQDPDLVPINVKRLLMLLRRAALRLGPTFVFEPNGGVFRRSVEREFTALLDGLHRRGAFAGATPDQSFQVAVDASLNDPASVDQGRFVVELKVAPSLPLSFLTVRLVQSGSGALVTEAA